MLLQSDEDRAEMLMKGAQKDSERRWKLYEQLAAMDYSKAEPAAEEPKAE